MNKIDSYIDKLESKQAEAITALLVQPTIGKAAKAAKLGEATLYRWLREDVVFQEAYRQARRELLNHAITKVQQTATEAVDTLKLIMKDSTTPPSARVRAAVALLDIAFRAVELEDLEARIVELEDVLGRKPRGTIGQS